MAVIKPVAAATIVVGGTPLDQKYMAQFLDVTVRDNLLLPDTAVVRLRDPMGEHLDSHPLQIGASLEVKTASKGQATVVPLFQGEIVALEPEFTRRDCVIAARAYDRGYKLNARRRSATYQNQAAEDMVKQVASAVGLAPGQIDSTGAVHDYFQQSMETDWEFCWRLAMMYDCEFVVEDRKFHFRKRKRAWNGVTLEWGASSDEHNGRQLLAFKPRMSGIGQAASVTVANHDPKARAPLSGAASTPELKGASKAVQERAQTVGRLGGGAVVVADRVVTTQGEAANVAQATLDRLASTFVEADGRATGDPALRAGATIKFENVGSFSGEYILSQTTHVLGEGKTYETAFVISGRSGHTFSDLLRNGSKPSWSSSLVVGVVTNNNDPDGMGRVRVKFPALGDAIEGWWARVATLNAGKERGMFMMPQPGDEVVVAFEHGDTRRPFVLGSLYTGMEKVPPDLKDASTRKAAFGVKSDHNVHVEGQQAMTLRSHEKMTVEVQRDGQGGTGDFLLDAKGNVEQKAAQNFKATATQSIEIQANQSVTIKGTGSVTVEASGSLKLKGATVDIEGTGPVNVKGAIINLG
jgi:uncharacterized protein involved in type VI secretion and phage assembly